MTTVSEPIRAGLGPELHLPERILRWPLRVRIGVFLFLLMGISAVLRTRYIGGQFWMDEALSTGIASHPLGEIPGVLRHDGSPPLYYLLLHFWITLFGDSESATHLLSLLSGLMCIPVGMWAAKSLFGMRAGVFAAVLFAFSAFLTDYSQETRMYSLMALLGLLATTGFLHAFVFRRRKFIALFAVAQALMLYTHAWGIFFGAGAAIALLALVRISDEPRELLRDGVLAFVFAGVLFLPWLPNFIYQATHTAAPWDSSPRFGAPVQLSRDLLGGDRVTIALLIASVIGLVEFGQRQLRRTPQAKATLTMVLIPLATLVLAWVASQITPAWVSRYFAPILGPVLLVSAFGLSRARIVGWVAIGASIIFLANPASFTPQYKSDMRDVGGEMQSLLHQGDLVITAQPEQIALMWYYLPGGLRYASTLGPVPDPRYMNWVNALDRFEAANPNQILTPLINSLSRGQQLLYVRPITDEPKNWTAPWTRYVRRRAAQWGAILEHDVAAGILTKVTWAPHNYQGACCVADSALLYKKVL